MSQRLLGALAPVLFLSLALSGCADTGPGDCYAVPWPDENYEADYKQVHANGTVLGETRYEFGGLTEAVRGDGARVEAIEIRQGGARHYLSVSNGDMVRYEPYLWVELNAGIRLVPFLLLGRCIEGGDAWTEPFLTPSHNMEVKVTDHNASGVTVDVALPQVPGPAGSRGDPILYRAHWQAGAALPYRVEVYNIEHGGPVPATVLESLSQDGPLRAAPPTADPVPYGPLSTVGTTPCNERPMRQPSMNGIWPGLDASQYVTNMSEDVALGRYLERHPNACAALVSYETVDEPNSTAHVWTSIYVDASGDSFRKRFVNRCFEGVALTAIFGDCKAEDHYTTSETNGAFSGDAYNTSRIAVPDDTSVAGAVLSGLDYDAPNRIVWRAFGPGQRMALDPSVGRENEGGAFVFDFGVLQYDVDYVAYRGISPSAGQWSSNDAYAFPDGWLASLPLPEAPANESEPRQTPVPLD